MNTTTKAGVDVLAVMDELLLTYDGGPSFFPAQSRVAEARRAVDELVEAAKSGVETLENLVAINRIPPNSSGLRHLRAALAAIGGEA